MRSLVSYFDRHPIVAIALLIAAFGAAGTFDHTEEEKQAAYERGFIDGKRSQVLQSLGGKPDSQLATLCSKPWPDVPGAADARRIACSPL
jgi:hypothetical protein